MLPFSQSVSRITGLPTAPGMVGFNQTEPAARGTSVDAAGEMSVMQPAMHSGFDAQTPALPAPQSTVPAQKPLFSTPQLRLCHLANLQ